MKMPTQMPKLLIRRAEPTQTVTEAPNKPVILSRGRRRATPPFFHWWTHLTRTERIVTMSLAVGGLVAIVNSITWAIAASYMTRQKSKAQRIANSIETATILMEQERDSTPAMR